MGKFSKIFHHIESKDLRNKYEQKKVAKIKEEKKKGPSTVNNALFVGSTAELQKMLKQMGGGKR